MEIGVRLGLLDEALPDDEATGAESVSAKGICSEGELGGGGAGETAFKRCRKSQTCLGVKLEETGTL